MPHTITAPISTSRAEPPNIAAPPADRGLTQLWRVASPGLPSSRSSTAKDGLSALAARVLESRAIVDPDARAAFLNPRLTNLHDPALMPGLEGAATRLLAALRAGEPVAIYGDYDVDGVSATAILYHTFRAIAPAADIRTYIPHRVEEGYGLNADAVRQLVADGARVIVSVDCGITARVPAEAAREAGAELIITDHHSLPSDPALLPRAAALVHPRLPGSAYPYPDLCGAGVAYKLAWRLATMHAGSPRVGETLQRLLIDLLAFAALGSIADIVPLTGENRVLARFGLAQIKRSPFPGLRALVEAAGLADDDIDADHVGFALGPRLNACGRMGHAREAVELFTTAQGDRADSIAAGLCRLNDERRAEERRIAAAAAHLAETAGMTGDDRRAIVLAHDDWHPGVIGIACSRLVDLYHRPVILLSRREGRCRGSGRSIDGFDLHAALESCREHLEEFGGHTMAAGLSLHPDRLDAFAEAFTAHANSLISPDQLTPTLRIDCDAALDELTLDAARQLESLKPFGPGNPSPRIRVLGAQVAEDPRPMGKEGRHMSVRLRAPDGRGDAVRVVAWNWGGRRQAIVRGQTIDAVLSPRLNAWNGRLSVEAELHDLRPATR